MKILQIFGAVVAVHLLAFIFIFASPGCQSGPRTMPTPDATVPTGTQAAAPSAPYNSSAVSPQPVDLGTPAPAYAPLSSGGHATPTRPGSAAAVAVTPEKPAESVSHVSEYTVGKGDSLWSIAQKNHLTVAELAKANGVSTGTVLKPGRKLMIPGKVSVAAPKDRAMTTSAPSVPPEKSAAAHPASSEGTKHTVQNGESLSVIARKYGITVGELSAANNITNPSSVRAGQQLVIPGGKAVVNKAAAPATKTPAAGHGGSSSAKAPADAATKPAESPAPAEKAPVTHFDLTPPPPGQDLDSGLKPAETEVPTIKVEGAQPAAKN